MEIISDYLYLDDKLTPLDKLNEMFLYRRGVGKDNELYYHYIVIGPGSILDDKVRFPIRKIRLLIPEDPEKVLELPHNKLNSYTTRQAILIGSGSYGRVVQSGNYAIKTFLPNKEVNPYLDISFLREVSVMLHLDHPNIVRLIDIVEGDPLNQIKDSLSIILPLANFNLEEYLRSYGNKDKKYIVYELVKGFEYLQSKDIVHGDIKLNNVLVFLDINGKPSFKITDFGLSINTSCLYDYLKNEAYNVYYRPLEVLLRLGYGLPADIWALACMIYYIYTYKVLFYESSDESLSEDQRPMLVIKRIIATLGDPKGKWDLLDKALDVYGIKAMFKSSNLSLIEQVGDESIYNILLNMLQYNPSSRISLSEVLKDPVFEEYASDINKLDCSGILDERQKYQTVLPDFDNKAKFRLERLEVSKRLLSFLQKLKIKTGIGSIDADIKDFFKIMYIFDYTVNILIDTIDKIKVFMMACAELYMWYKYGQSVTFKYGYSNTSDKEYADQIIGYIKVILNTLNFDLIFTDLSEYLKNYESENITPSLIKAVENNVVTEYLPKEIISAVAFYDSNLSIFDIVKKIDI